MKKILALVLVLLIALPMALALTKADLMNFGKVSRVSPLATSSGFSADIGQKLFADRFREALGPRVRIPPGELECVKQATPETFDRLVLESRMPVVVGFWAPWCGYCTRFKPVFDHACEEYRGRMKFVAFNTDHDDGIWERFGMRGIPTQIFFYQGEEVHRNVGATTIERFRGILDSVLRNL
ncbi:MAG: thioredoxin domain-containing protein [Nanoarchaeota archaeon]|nr:thioredoxin domain-containing protein [Nanoarchaeota archaeon]